MEGYNKTDKNGLNIITNDNIYDIDPIMENFNTIDDSIGKVDSVNMEGYDEDSEVSSEKSLTNYIKYIWKKLGSIELTDLKVVVTTWENNKLSEVLKEIKKWIDDIKESIVEIKNLYTIQNQLLDDNVSRLKAANDMVEKLIK